MSDDAPVDEATKLLVAGVTESTERVIRQMEESSVSASEISDTFSALAGVRTFVNFLGSTSDSLSSMAVTDILEIVRRLKAQHPAWTETLRSIIIEVSTLVRISEHRSISMADNSWRLMAGQVLPEVREGLDRLELIIFKNQDLQLSGILAQSREVLENTKAAAATLVANGEQVAELTLGDSFKRVADGEERQANAFRWFAIAMFPLAFAIALVVVDKDQTFRWSAELIKLVIDIPIIAAVFFFQSEAKDHRQNARRAREIEIRLATVRAYTDGLPESQRDEVRTSLGLAIFKEPTLLSAPKGADEAAANVLEKVAELMKAARG